MKKILILQMKAVCYDSYRYFASSLGTKLALFDVTAEYFDGTKEPLENLERCVGKYYDAVLDFNSDLPRLQMDDGSFFLDHIHAPFYDVILDHPLYHHDTLKQPLSDFHVLCLDENHRDYISSCYPHIKSAHVFAMTGESSAFCDRPFEKRSMDLLFSGTYTPSRLVWESISHIPGFMEELTKELIEQMEADSSLTQEAALKSLLPDLDEVVEETFPLHMQACFLADTYLRARRREVLIQELAGSGLRLTLCGNGWDTLPVTSRSRLRYISDLSFANTFDLMADAKITLNIMPGFLAGTHDRVYSALLNRSLCLTDSSTVLEKEFKDKQELCFYDANKPGTLSAAAARLLSNPGEAAAIALRGFENACENHTWTLRAEKLVSLLPSL